MHIKLEIKTSLPTHNIARALWVPEFYTLHELNHVLQASFGWEEERAYAFLSEDLSWIPCQQIEGEDIENGLFLAEGTTLSEVLKFWRDEGATYETGCRSQWEFHVEVVDSRETHPDNMTCILEDGQGDMPEDMNAMRRQFIDAHNSLIQDDTLIVSRLAKANIHVEHTLGLCSELVSTRSVEISKSRRLPEH
jgi:hypothetical protein